MSMNKNNKERKKVTSCGAVTWRRVGGRLEVLLIKQFARKEKWGIPKGHINDCETLEACAVREVREETGVEVRLSTRLPDCHVTNHNEDKTVVAWLAQPAGGNEEPNINDPDSEVADARWFSIDKLPDIVVYQRPLLATTIKLLCASADASTEQPI